VRIGLAVVLEKAVVDDNLGGRFQVVGCTSAGEDSLARAGFQVVGCMSAEVDSLGARAGFQVVGCMSAEVDSLEAWAGIQVVGCKFVEVDSLAGTVFQQRRLEHGHLGMVNNYALEADAEESGPFLVDLDCIPMNAL